MRSHLLIVDLSTYINCFLFRKSYANRFKAFAQLSDPLHIASCWGLDPFGIEFYAEWEKSWVKEEATWKKWMTLPGLFMVQDWINVEFQ